MSGLVRRIEDQVGPHLHELGAPSGWAEKMAAHLELLHRWNDRVNLVSRRAIDRVLEDQLVPSLAALLAIPAGSKCRVLDIGSGGGFPGIPVAICRPESRVDLVESTRKKCDFLAAAIREVGLGSTVVHWCRIESPTEGLRERAPFDLAFARAVGQTERVARAASPLLSETGSFWAFGPPGAPGGRPWPRENPRTAILQVLPPAGEP